MEGTMQKEMPLYRSHKTVRALKIARVESTHTGDIRCHFEDESFGPSEFNVDHKPRPEAGWYLVQYGDGYVSFSPGQQFEEGNTLELVAGGTFGGFQSAGPSDLGMGTGPGPAMALPDLRSFSQADLENWFSYHAPTTEQLHQYGAVRYAAKIFAETINRHCPGSADKSAAMRLLRECVMTANASIACYTPPEPREC